MLWRNRAIEVHKIPDVDYFLFLDESGEPDLTNFDEGKPVFSVCGVIVQAEEYAAIKRRINAFKESYWENGIFFNGSGYDKVVFRSRDIRRRRGAFSSRSFNDERYSGFIDELCGMISGLPFELIGSAVDKRTYVIDEQEAKNNANLPTFTFILERFTNLLNSRKKRGLIVTRSRGTREDAFFSELFLRMFNKGTGEISSKVFRRTIVPEIYFDTGQNSENENIDSFIGLEIANLCAYPIGNYIVNGDKLKAFQSLETKFSEYPHYGEKGLKIFR